MRSKDSALMQKILTYLNDYYRENCSMPSTAAIGRALGLVKSTVYKYLLAMDACGMLRYHDGVITLDIQKFYSPLSHPAAVYSDSILCGTQNQAETVEEEYVQLPTSIFGDDNFLIRIRDCSLFDAGIEAGDLVVVHRQAHAASGALVAMSTPDGCFLRHLQCEEGRCQVCPPPEDPAVQHTEAVHQEILGVVSYIIHKAR